MFAAAAAVGSYQSFSAAFQDSNSPRGPPIAQTGNVTPQPGTFGTETKSRVSPGQIIGQAADAVLTPISNSLLAPGWNYGGYLADLDAGKGVMNPHLYGAMLDSLLVIGTVYTAFEQAVVYGPQRNPFVRYTGPKSDPAGTWMTRSSSSYGTDYAKAMDRLSSPIQWNNIKRVSVPWEQYVAGPRPAAPLWDNVAKRFVTSGGGLEYRTGGFGNWPRYFATWLRYFFQNWE